MKFLKYLQLALFIIFTVVAPPLILSTRCPSSCRCYEQTEISSIFCVSSTRTSIPNSFDFAVKILNYSGNHLATLANAFRNPYYKSLEILDLNGNGIESIADKAFYKLKNLLEIDLSNNNIRSFDEKLFKKNPFLNTIRIRSNPLEEIKSYALPALIYLKTLDFQGCKLKKIHRAAFINTPSLQTLNLKDNNLKSLPFSILRLSQLALLWLDGNPWRCDENLWYVLKWIQSKNASADTSLLCVYGETDNAIFWDTMDVNNPKKFENVRTKRTISASENARIKMFMKNRIAVLRARRIREVKTSKAFYKKEENTNCTQFNEYAAGKLEYPKFNDTNVDVVNSPKNRKDTASNAPQLFQYDHVEIQLNYADQPVSYENSGRPKSKLQTSPVRVDIHSSKEEKRGHENADYEGEDSNERGNEEQENDRMNLTRVSKFANNLPDFEEHDDDNVEETFDMKIMVLLIGLELALLIILLFILYKLWKWNRNNSAEPGVNIPLNNGKKIKSYDSQTSGYKRYSLSDEEYADMKNNGDDAKYDAESGYLSYHRYNSLEGDNNDYVYYKRQPYGNDKEDENSNESNPDSTTRRDSSSSRRSRNDSVKSNGSRSNVDDRNHSNGQDSHE